MNEETLKEVCPNDWPQRTRNILRADQTTQDAGFLKEAINNFLWRHLPCKTTIREAEIMACKIFALIMNEKDK